MDNAKQVYDREDTVWENKKTRRIFYQEKEESFKKEEEINIVK